MPPKPRKPLASNHIPLPEGVTVNDIPLVQPNYTRDPSKKTLLDVIEEKRPRDKDGNPIAAYKKDGEAGEGLSDEEGEEEIIGPFAQTFFYNVPLIFLLAAFEVVCYQQYAQDLDYRKLVIKCAQAFPVFFALIYMTHPYRKHLLAQFGFFVCSVSAGCWLVHASNRYAYYAVMKKAPPIGVLWIWAAVEMNLEWLMASCAIVLGWLWYGDYKVL